MLQEQPGERGAWLGYVGRGSECPCPPKLATLPLSGFTEALLHGHNRLNHWPLVTELSLQLLSPPQRGLKVVSNHLLIPLVTSPHSEATYVLPQSHLIHTTKDTCYRKFQGS